jgi:hypothetical protein
MVSETALLLTNQKLVVQQTHPILMLMTQIFEHQMLYPQLQILPLLHFTFHLWVSLLPKGGKYVQVKLNYFSLYVRWNTFSAIEAVVSMNLLLQSSYVYHTSWLDIANF